MKLLEKFNLKTTLNKDKNYQRIRFTFSSVPKLKELIKENIIPSMNYKLGYNPVET